MSRTFHHEGRYREAMSLLGLAYRNMGCCFELESRRPWVRWSCICRYCKTGTHRAERRAEKELIRKELAEVGE